MDMKKSFKVAKMPVVAIVVLAIAGSLIGAIPVLQTLMCVLGLPLFLVNIALYLYIGYLLAKAGMEIVDSAVLGGITGAVAGVISALVSLVAAMLGMGMYVGMGGSALEGSLDVGFTAAAGVVGIVIGIVIGAVIAAIGHLVGNAMAKKK